MLEGLKFYNDGKIAVATVTQAMLRETGANEDVLDDISSIPGQIAGVFVGVTIRELRDGNSKVSLRTLPQVNACEICKAFGGGGHDMAAGCTLTENVEKTRELIVSETMAQWPEGI